MLTFSQEQLFDRWDHLPTLLREAMYAPEVSDTLWKVCEGEHLHDDKIHVVAKIVGFVFMGLISPSQMAREITDELGIDIRIAISIAGAVTQRIFAPLRADIDKVYNPITTSTMVPKIIEEIRPVVKTLTSAPVSLPSIPSPAPTPANVIAPQKQDSTKPILSKPPAPVDEFARLGKNTAPSSSIPKPVMLQSESVPRPIPNAPNFRVPTVSEDVMRGRQGSMPLPSAPAIVEFGGAPIPKSITPQPATTPKVTVIRYGSERSAPPGAPPRPESMRTITEITPETLKNILPTPPAAPSGPSFTPLSQIPVPSPVTPKPFSSPTSAPLTPPTPPKPQQQIPSLSGQPEKVIQKDYSTETK